MARSTLLLLQVILPILFITATAKVATPKPKVATPKPSENFIKKCCEDTTYPYQCLELLTPYAGTIQQSPLKLAQAAIEVSLAKAKIGQSKISPFKNQKGLKPDEHKAVDVCAKKMDEIVNKLTQSVAELKLIGKNNSKGAANRIATVQTWVGATVSDQCSDAFADMGLQDTDLEFEVLSKAEDTEKTTINALALLNMIPTTTKS